MRLPLLLAGLLAAAPCVARAAGPTIKPGYQINVFPQYGQPSYDYMSMMSWLDTTNTSIDPAGQATPVSPLSPFPVTVMGGTAPGPATGTHTPLTITTIAPGASAVVIAPGAIKTGCDIGTSGSTFVYAYGASPTVSAANATTGTPSGSAQYYHCPGGTTQGLGLYNNGSATLTVGGDVY